MSVREIVVQCLLHTEATRTVLDLIKTGVDTVEAVFTTQSRPVVLHRWAVLGACATTCIHLHIFRSTFLSRTDEVGLKCPSVRVYVRTSVCPQKVSLISVKFGM